MKRYNYSPEDTSTDEAEAILGEIKSHTDAAVKSAVKPIADEVAAVKQQVKELAQQGAAQFAALSVNGPRETMGSALIKHASFSDLRDRRVKAISSPFEVKNTILGESGNPQNPDRVLSPADRLPGVVGAPLRQLSILDVLPVGVTGSNLVEYTKEASFTNNAAETSEGDDKSESALTFTLEQAPVRTIAHYLRISRQALDDAPSVASYIDTRLSHGVRQRLESQVITGNGTTPNIAGLTKSGNYTPFTPDVMDTPLDALNRAKYAMIAADFSPAIVMLNPEDFGAIERTKADETSNAYAVGDGNGLQYVSNGLAQLWGLSVVVSNHIPEGSFVMLDPSAVMLFIRQQANVELFEQDDQNVTKNLVTVRAEMRAALAVFNAGGVVYGALTAES